VRSRFSPADRTALTGRPGLSALVETWEEDARRTADAADRLRAVKAPLVELPRLTSSELSRAELNAFGETLQEALG